MQSLESGYAGFVEALLSIGLQDWQAPAHSCLQQQLFNGVHGDLPRWRQALAQLPEVSPSVIKLNADAVRIGSSTDLCMTQHQQMLAALRELHPWRKGPLDLFGTLIDTEWRSDWKWQRLCNHISDMTDRQVLDVGCGNGYYALRMLGAGAQRVIGIDPTLVFVMQHLVFRHFLPALAFHILPCGIDDMPVVEAAFDSVFSMGVIYHRRDPLPHLRLLHQYLRSGGELVLETLVIDARDGELLIPDGRYARMRNVWHIPSVSRLEEWLDETGFTDIRCVDISTTTTDEQRPTEWMHFESLAHCLDPHDGSLTVEGHPAPRRAVMIACKN